MIKYSGGFIDITPKEPVQLGGFAARSGMFKGLNDSLEANIVVFKTSERTVVMAQLDLLYVGSIVSERVRAAFRNTLADEDLFLCSSHSHFTPNTEPRLCQLGAVDEDYIEYVTNRLVELISRCLDDPGIDASFSYSNCDTKGILVNRRDKRWILRKGWPPIWRSFGWFPNDRGLRDDTIRTVSIVESESTEKMAFLWNYACHPVSFPDTYKVSADYPGVVRNRLRKIYGESVPVVFLQGFTGDIRPRVFDRSPKLKRRICRAIEGSSFGAFTVSEWQQWADQIADYVIRSVENEPIDIGQVALKTSAVVQPLSSFMNSDAQQLSVVFRSVNLSEKLIIVGISAEPVVEYLPMLARLAADKSVIPVGYVDDVFGYLPTSELIPEGGYEVDGFRASFSIAGKFRADVSDKVEDALTELLAS